MCGGNIVFSPCFFVIIVHCVIQRVALLVSLSMFLFLSHGAMGVICDYGTS